MDHFKETFKDSDFYPLLNKWGLLKDEIAINNMLKKAIDYFKKSKQKDFKVLNHFLKILMQNMKGGYKKLQAVPTHAFIATLSPIENVPEECMRDIFACAVEANLDFIDSQFQENPIFETIDRNNLETLDICKEINNSNFDDEHAANEFYLAFAWHLYLAAIHHDASPLFEDELETEKLEDLSEFWAHILFACLSFDADAPEWDQLPYFFKKLEALKTDKKQKKKKEAQQQIDIF